MNDRKKASSYLNTTTSFLYRYKMLFSMDTFYKSIESIEHSMKLGIKDYTRTNIKQTYIVSKKENRKMVDNQLALYGNKVFGSAYHFNNNLYNYYKTIKEQNPNTRFIIFTNPISSELFKKIVQKGNLSDYEKWITMLVDIFGEIYDFMGINSITKDLSNYIDAHHYYPRIGKLIAHKITNIDDPLIPKDFGVLVNKKNLKKHLQKIREQVRKW